jgi:hypothetical protein
MMEISKASHVVLQAPTSEGVVFANDELRAPGNELSPSSQ